MFRQVILLTFLLSSATVFGADPLTPSSTPDMASLENNAPSFFSPKTEDDISAMANLNPSDLPSDVSEETDL